MTDHLRTSACPSCGASVRPDAQWCGQCYADFRPKPAPEPAAAPPTAPAPRAAYGVPAPDPLTQPLVDLVLPLAEPPAVPAEEVASAGPEPTWPCTRCEHPNPITESACVACGAGFLAAMKDAEGPLLALPLVGDLTTMSRGRRMLLAFAVVLAIVVPFALLMLLTS